MKDKIIDIFNTKYTIQLKDSIVYENSEDITEGLCDSSTRTIELATLLPNGKEIPLEDINKNLWHELIHTILNEGQYLDYSNNEPFVEWMARCVYSLIQQDITIRNVK